MFSLVECNAKIRKTTLMVFKRKRASLQGKGKGCKVYAIKYILYSYVVQYLKYEGNKTSRFNLRFHITLLF